MFVCYYIIILLWIYGETMLMSLTGDWMRSSLPDLELVINSGVRVLIYDGDAVRAFISPWRGEHGFSELDWVFRTTFSTLTVSRQW
jgi:hypothetical protein